MFGCLYWCMVHSWWLVLMSIFYYLYCPYLFYNLYWCVVHIGRFSEVGLREWMPCVIFRAWSCERSQHHFQADFWVGIASHCVNFRIVKQYKCHHCCSCKNYREKGMEVGKKVSLHCFFWQIWRSCKKCVLGHPVGWFSEAGLLEWMRFVIFR